MGKYKYWEMDNTKEQDKHVITATQDAINKDAVLKKFRFTVSRYKDTGTKKEYIKIVAEVDKELSGEIDTDLIEMANDMPTLRAYGVVLDRAKYVELGQLIAQNYYSFKKVDTQKINNIDDIFALFCQYIADNNTAPVKIKNEELYNVELSTFNKELSDSQYRQYNTTDVKEALFNKGYTTVNKGKFDYVVTVEENGEKKKKKMVSFKKKPVDDMIAKIAAAK